MFQVLEIMIILYLDLYSVTLHFLLQIIMNL